MTTTTKSLTTELVKSRHYDPVSWQMWYASPMVDLVTELEAECASRGLTLSRWQTNRGSKAVSITYAIHTGGARPPVPLPTGRDGGRGHNGPL
jgi:hypothetical protein